MKLCWILLPLSFLLKVFRFPQRVNTLSWIIYSFRWSMRQLCCLQTQIQCLVSKNSSFFPWVHPHINKRAETSQEKWKQVNKQNHGSAPVDSALGCASVCAYDCEHSYPRGILLLVAVFGRSSHTKLMHYFDEYLVLSDIFYSLQGCCCWKLSEILECNCLIAFEMHWSRYLLTLCLSP